MKMVLKDKIRQWMPSSLKSALASLITANFVGWVIRYDREYLQLSGIKFFIKHPRISNKEVAALYLGLREYCLWNQMKS